MYVAEAGGYIPDFSPANCQKENGDLWVALHERWDMGCLCLDPVTGEVIKEDHDCNRPCEASDERAPGKIIRLKKT